MILQALKRLAEQERLVVDPDFEVKPVSWIIHLGRDASLAGIVSHRVNVNEGTNRKPKYVGKPMLVPRQSIRTSGDAAFFLVDKSEYVLGFDPAGKRPPKKLRVRFNLFKEQVDVAVMDSGKTPLNAVQQFLTRMEEFHDQIRTCFENNPWASNDLFAFRVGTELEPVHLHPEVREHWRKRRKTCGVQPGSESLTCLVSGDPIAESGLFPLVKRVPGGTPSGISLVSFNARAFESFGLSGNENAPVSREAAEEAATALNRLIDPEYPDPHNPERALPRRSLKVGSDTIVCYWAASEAKDVQHAVDLLAPLFQGDPEAGDSESEEDVAEVYRSPRRGKRRYLETPSAFYVLILSGAQGRAIVRDWIETTLAETLDNLDKHFDDLAIVRQARPKKGSKPTSTIPLRWLVDSLAAEGKSESVPGSVEAGFLRAAFTGTPYPFQILQRALVRARVEAGRDGWIDASRRDARAALIKAVLNRRRSDPQAADRYPEVPMSLSPQLDNAGYALGGLMAVLERLQQIAQGDVNASVVDRYFSAASASPRAVFVRLLKNARHHARKAADQDDRRQRAFAFRLDRMIDYFCDRFDIDRKRFPDQTAGIPSHLDLEQQGLFVLGYHQMRHWLWMPSNERLAWERNHPDAAAVFVFSKAAPEEAEAIEA